MVSNAFRKTNVLQVLLYPSTTGTHLLPRLVHGAHRSSALCMEHGWAGATQCSSFLIKVWRSFTNKLFISCYIILYLFLVSLIFPTGQLQIHSANQSDLQLLVPYWILLVPCDNTVYPCKLAATTQLQAIPGMILSTPFSCLLCFRQDSLHLHHAMCADVCV